MILLSILAKFSALGMVAVAIQQGSAVAAFPAESADVARYEAGTQSALFNRAKITQIESPPPKWVARYKSDWMLPMFPELETPGYSTQAADGFAGVFSTPGFQTLMQHLISGGSAGAQDVGQNGWNALAQSIPILSDSERGEMTSGVGSFSMSFQPRVMFRSPSGGLLFEVNGLRCPEALEGLAHLFGQLAAPGAEVERCPRPLLAKIATGKVSAPANGKLYDLKGLVDEMSRANHVPLYVDRRILGMQIALAAKNGSIDYKGLMTLIPDCLDLYWRPVGSVWFLGCSPGAPWDEAEKRKAARQQEGLAKLGSLAFTEGDPRSKYAYRQWMNSTPNLGSLTSDQAEGLGKILGSCGGSEGQAKFRQLMQSGVLNSKVKLEFSMGFDYTVSLPSGTKSGFVSNR